MSVKADRADRWRRSAPADNPLANLQVDASTGIVLPNGSFQYAVTVPNIAACTLNNVKVVLTVTGPAGYDDHRGRTAAQHHRRARRSHGPTSGRSRQVH